MVGSGKMLQKLEKKLRLVQGILASSGPSVPELINLGIELQKLGKCFNE